MEYVFVLMLTYNVLEMYKKAGWFEENPNKTVGT